MAGPVAAFDSSSYYKVRSLYITRPPIPSLAWMLLSAMLYPNGIQQDFLQVQLEDDFLEFLHDTEVVMQV